MTNYFIDITKTSGALTGTLTFTNGSVAVTGSGTAFTTELAVGDYIKPTTTDEWYRVQTITDDENLTLDWNFAQSTQSGVSAVYNDKDGLSTANAFCHIGQAFADNILVAGDKVYMRRGQTHLYARNTRHDIYENGAEGNKIHWLGDDGTGWAGETGLDKPVIGFGDVGNGYINFEGDRYWLIEDIEFKESSSPMGHVRFYQTRGNKCKKCDFHDNSAATNARGMLVGYFGPHEFEECTFYSNLTCGIYAHSLHLILKKCTFNGGPATQDYGIQMDWYHLTTIEAHECDFGQTTAHDNCDIAAFTNPVWLRNCNINDMDFKLQYPYGVVYIEDHNGTKLDNRKYAYMGNVLRNTTVTRTGGADSSAECIPNSHCVSCHPLKMFEMVIWTPASQSTFEVYLRGSGWTTFPTASELWIELEYFSDAENADRTITKSDEVLTTNDTWTKFEVPNITPTAAGPAYLRGYLVKYESGAKVYVDIKPIVS